MGQRTGDAAVGEMIISRDPETMGGQPVFTGTRVPVTHLIELLVAGRSIDEFLHGFPTVQRDQVTVLLNHIGELITDGELTA